jgi:hypothetical protein
MTGMPHTRSAILLAASSVLFASCGGPEPMNAPVAAGAAGVGGAVASRAATAPVPNDPDDPAIWVNDANPGGSLIIGTDKQEGVGGLYVFGLDGRLRQAITPMDRPNN